MVPGEQEEENTPGIHSYHSYSETENPAYIYHIRALHFFIRNKVFFKFYFLIHLKINKSLNVLCSMTKTFKVL